MAKKNREINVFSTSAIDLFASSLGVFIVLVIIIIPFYRKKSTISPQVVAELKEEVKEKEVIEQKMKEIEKELKEAQKRIKLTQDMVPKEELEEIQKKLKKKQEITKQMVPQKELEKVKRKLKILQKQQRTIASVDQEREELIREVQKQKEVQQTLRQEVEQKVRKEQDLQRKVEQLEAKITEKKAKMLQGAFVAIIIKWATPQHDIDLVVKDSRGRTFNFKKRNYTGHPGKFSLDSRTGPGAELWQSARLIPGRYTVTYNFYNPYGNNDPAVVTGTIFTKEGSIELPKTKLDFSKKRTATFRFTVSNELKVTL